jgi:post-segregation antitoxin (ccd killing protein)
MAISKQDAMEKAESRTADKMKALEAKIDKALVRDARDRRMTTIATSGMKQATIEAIIRKYKAAGWKVEHVSDWRDGDYLSFE